MLERIRKQKVSELNRILPMVRETISKERKIRQLEDKKEKEQDLSEGIQASITNIKSVLKMPQEVCVVKEDARKNLEELLNKQEGKLEESLKMIDEITHKITELSAIWKYETNLYVAILRVIITKNDGFVLAEEIQEEFLEEYIYLLTLEGTFLKNITIPNIFKGFNARDKLFEMISKRHNGMLILDAIDNEKLNRETFFKLFE